MRVVGVIAEYNPFHNGHLYHLRESVKMAAADAVLVVMSGNFTQRGQPAIMDKWHRARVAVCAGADLVWELPFVYACNSAEHFAQGAVEMLSGLGCVDVLSFGSESGDIEALAETAALLAAETPAFQDAMKESLAKGNAHPRARAEAAGIAGGQKHAALLRRPNNILAVEYIRKLVELDSNIKPMTVLRKGAGHDETALTGAFSSATAIRNALLAGTDAKDPLDAVPAVSRECLLGLNLDINKILNNQFLLLAAKIATADEADLAAVLSAGEGLDNRIKKASRRAENMEELIGAIKSKRYTRSRIERLLVHTLIGLTKADFAEIRRHKTGYARVLAFSETGAALLKRIKKEGAGIPVITNINKQTDDVNRVRDLLRYDLRAADLYNLMAGRQLYAYSDYVRKPYCAGEVI